MDLTTSGASRSVGDRQENERAEGTTDEVGRTKSEADKGGMEGAEKAGEFIYRSGGANRVASRERGRFVATDEAERFWSKVDRSGPCWLWTGGTTSDGYGRFVDRQGLVRRAHRWAWEATYGPLGDLTLDHLIGSGEPCGSRLCVRPSHLEPVTNAQNVARRHARQRARQENSDVQ